MMESIDDMFTVVQIVSVFFKTLVGKFADFLEAKLVPLQQQFFLFQLVGELWQRKLFEGFCLSTYSFIGQVPAGPGQSDARANLPDLWLESEWRARVANGSGRDCPDCPIGDGPI
jgi:hypothetical protein